MRHVGLSGIAVLLLTATADAQYGDPPTSPYRAPVDSRGVYER